VSDVNSVGTSQFQFVSDVNKTHTSLKILANDNDKGYIAG